MNNRQSRERKFNIKVNICNERYYSCSCNHAKTADEEEEKRDVARMDFLRESTSIISHRASLTFCLQFFLHIICTYRNPKGCE
jgi:hypothetical protein